MNYVQQREFDLKQEYAANMWWIRICNLWETLGKVISLQRDADYYTSEVNKIRSQYIRKGRKAGYSPKKAA